MCFLLFPCHRGFGGCRKVCQAFRCSGTLAFRGPAQSLTISSSRQQNGRDGRGRHRAGRHVALRPGQPCPVLPSKMPSGHGRPSVPPATDVHGLRHCRGETCVIAASNLNCVCRAAAWSGRASCIGRDDVQRPLDLEAHCRPSGAKKPSLARSRSTAHCRMIGSDPDPGPARAADGRTSPVAPTARRVGAGRGRAGQAPGLPRCKGAGRGVAAVASAARRCGNPVCPRRVVKEPRRPRSA